MSQESLAADPYSQYLNERDLRRLEPACDCGPPNNWNHTDSCAQINWHVDQFDGYIAWLEDQEESSQ